MTASRAAAQAHAQASPSRRIGKGAARRGATGAAEARAQAQAKAQTSASRRVGKDAALRGSTGAAAAATAVDATWLSRVKSLTDAIGSAKVGMRQALEAELLEFMSRWFDWAGAE